MARTNAISLLAGASTPATLAEIYGRVIENVQKSTLSTTLKSQLGSVYLDFVVRNTVAQQIREIW